MNAHAPYNEPATSLQQTLFALQGYGVQVYHTSQVVAMEPCLQVYPQVRELLVKVRAAGWFVQFGILK